MRTRLSLLGSAPIVTLVWFALFFASQPRAFAQGYAHIWVDGVNGQNVPDAGSQTKPYKTITYAIAREAAKGTPDPWHLHILPATYDTNPAKPAVEREVFPIPLRQGIILEGLNAATCIIDGQYVANSAVPLVRGQRLLAFLMKNLTLRNMKRVTGNGGAVELIECSGDFEGCVFEKNESGQQIGGGIDATGSFAGNLVRCVFRNNYAAGAWFRGGFVGDVLEVQACDNGGYGIAAAAFRGRVADSAFDRNGDCGLALTGGFDGTLERCTFVGNGGRYGWYASGFAVDGGFTGRAMRCRFDDNVGCGWYGPSGSTAAHIEACCFVANRSVGCISGGIYGGVRRLYVRPEPSPHRHPGRPR